MGASASTLNVDSSCEGFPKCGVSLHFLKDLYVHCGGKIALEGLTTTEVCEKFVKPLTERWKCSVCDLLKAGNHHAYRTTADVFISHAWKYKFLDVMDAVENHFQHYSGDIVIWFDMFCNNQHKAVELDFHWWSTTFRSAIKDFGYTVMVLAPWKDPIPLTRAWCLYELWSTAEQGCKFEVAMSEKEQAYFLDDIDDDNAMIKTVFSKIDVQRSESFNPADKQKIFDIVEKSIGFAAVNKTVQDSLRQWVIATAQSHLTKKPNNTTLMSTLAHLHESQGNFHAAIKLLLDCVAKSKVLLGDNHDDTLRFCEKLATIYSNQGDYTNAETWYLECIAKRKATPDKNVIEKEALMVALNRLAVVYKEQGKYTEALSLYEEILTETRAQYGEEHTSIINIMESIAGLYANQGNYEEGERLHVQCLANLRRLLGDKTNKTDLYISMQNLALLYETQGKYDSAEELYVECIECIQKDTEFSDKHPLFLQIRTNLGILYTKQEGKMDRAESILQDCYEKRRIINGDNHPETLNVMQILAQFYFQSEKLAEAEILYDQVIHQKRILVGEDDLEVVTLTETVAILKGQLEKFQEAERLLKECLLKRKAKSSASGKEEDKIALVSVLGKIGLLYAMFGQFEQAEPLLVECWEGRKVVLGVEHPETLVARNLLATVYAQEGKEELAETLFNAK